MFIISNSVTIRAYLYLFLIYVYNKGIKMVLLTMLTDVVQMHIAIGI